MEDERQMKAEILASKALILCAIAMVLLASCGGSTTTPGTDGGSAPESGTPESESGTGIPAPDFSFETFEGETFSSAEQRGTPIVLNFWESW